MTIETKFNIGEDVYYGISRQTRRRARVMKVIYVQEVGKDPRIVYDLFVPAFNKVLHSVSETSISQ